MVPNNPQTPTGVLFTLSLCHYLDLFLLLKILDKLVLTRNKEANVMAVITMPVLLLLITEPEAQAYLFYLLSF
jgi:hypothetical protein